MYGLRALASSDRAGMTLHPVCHLGGMTCRLPSSVVTAPLPCLSRSARLGWHRTLLRWTGEAEVGTKSGGVATTNLSSCSCWSCAQGAPTTASRLGVASTYPPAPARLGMTVLPARESFDSGTVPGASVQRAWPPSASAPGRGSHRPPPASR